MHHIDNTDTGAWDEQVYKWALEHSTHATVVAQIELLERRIQLLRGMLVGVGTNGTNCMMCRALNESANTILKQDDAMASKLMFGQMEKELCR